MICYARTVTGRVRNMNQDFLYASEKPIGPLKNLFIVADGMGGHKAGDYASRFVVEQMTDRIANASAADDAVMLLRRTVEQTNRLLYEEACNSPEKEGMGSTLVAATVDGDTMYVINVGDSRLYLLDGGLRQVTRDHSLVEEMVSRGKLVRGSEEYRRQKNIITRAMGIGAFVEPDVFEVSLSDGDCVLLCSDGLSNMVEDKEITRILKAGGTLKERGDRLIDRANENGGKDNISVVLVEPQTSEVRL